MINQKLAVIVIDLIVVNKSSRTYRIVRSELMEILAYIQIN